jgi:hypothetical protein
VPVFGKQGCVVTAYHPITIVTEIKPKIKRQKKPKILRQNLGLWLALMESIKVDVSPPAHHRTVARRERLCLP